MEPSTNWPWDTYDTGSSDINTRLRDHFEKGKEVALHSRNIDTTRPSSHSWNSETIDFIYNPLRKKDVTVHLDLDISSKAVLVSCSRPLTPVKFYQELSKIGKCLTMTNRLT